VLVAIAAPVQIAALSHYSRDPDGSSVPVETAHRFPFTYGSAEEVIALAPDLVLASNHSDLATRQALKRVGVEVMLFRTPDSVAESLAEVTRIARAIGRPGQGQAEVARIEAALAAAAPAPGTPPL